MVIVRVRVRCTQKPWGGSSGERTDSAKVVLRASRTTGPAPQLEASLNQLQEDLITPNLLTLSWLKYMIYFSYSVYIYFIITPKKVSSLLAGPLPKVFKGIRDNALNINYSHGGKDERALQKLKSIYSRETGFSGYLKNTPVHVRKIAHPGIIFLNNSSYPRPRAGIINEA